MSEMAFRRKSLNGQRPRVDRFLVPRSDLPEMCRRASWSGGKETDDIWCAKYNQQKKYANYLDEAFGLETLQHDARIEDDGVALWPCIPRKKRHLTSADNILDLPSYSYAAFPELLDWSSQNILVAALGRNYHKWSWHTQKLISQGITEYNIQCCKFDPTGRLLGLGIDNKAVEIHDEELSKCVDRSWCGCGARRPGCSVTAIDWSPTGNSFVTGCSHGMLSSFTKNAQPLRWYQAKRNAVLMVRVSPNARFVTATAVNDDEVLVLTWPCLRKYSVLETNSTIKALDWHPWRSALLAIGTIWSQEHDIYAQVGLWNVAADKVHQRIMDRNHHTLDSMLFSRRTGELVLSLWDTDTTSPGKTSSHLVVMSGPDTVVDQWGEGRTGLDRIRTMVFSPDGTKLATATADEDLIIWNFLPEDKKKRKKSSCRRFCAMPVYIDKALSGVSYR